MSKNGSSIRSCSENGDKRYIRGGGERVLDLFVAFALVNTIGEGNMLTANL